MAWVCPSLYIFVISNQVYISSASSSAPHCPRYHVIQGADPSGPVQTPDGAWHLFPINGNWGHCTSKDLFRWNCSHPATGWPADNTGGLTVTPSGYYLMQANGSNLSVAKATGRDLDVWKHTGIIGGPSDPPALFSDTSRAIKLKSGWYIPVGTKGPQAKGGGIHWMRADDDRMTHVTEKSYLFTVNGGILECPDVFQLGDKFVILGSIGGTEGASYWWVGTISEDDLTFTAESTGRFDYGKPGFSSLYAAKSGTSAFAPFTRRLLFGFGGWRTGEMSTCGGGWSSHYVLPRELSLSSSNKLLQHPAAELKGLRRGPEVHGTNVANGGQIEIFVQCQVPTVHPLIGVLGVNTLQHNGQFVQVGYDFGNMSGFVMVPASLGHGASRTDRAPLQTLLQGPVVELHVFVDGDMVETFFQGETTIMAVTSNQVPSGQLISTFVNTARLDCKVSSWLLGLPLPVPEDWTAIYCQSCGRNSQLRDLGSGIDQGECVDACVNDKGCNFVNHAESDGHCILYAQCKTTFHEAGCNASNHEWWTTFTERGVQFV